MDVASVGVACKLEGDTCDTGGIERTVTMRQENEIVASAAEAITCRCSDTSSTTTIKCEPEAADSYSEVAIEYEGLPALPLPAGITSIKSEGEGADSTTTSEAPFPLLCADPDTSAALLQQSLGITECYVLVTRLVASSGTSAPPVLVHTKCSAPPPHFDIDIDHPDIKMECSEAAGSILSAANSDDGEEMKLGTSVARERRRVRNTSVLQLCCTHCDYFAKRPGTLKRHMLLHSESKPYKCNRCDYTCKWIGNLKTHSLTHSNSKPHKCNVCRFSSKHLTALKRHLLIHSGSKPYRCSNCDYTCRQLGTLKIHALIHTNSKPYKCNECDYTCRQLGTLKAHALIHSGTYPYKCSDCDYSCRMLDNLKRHALIHSGEKPFMCTECDYKCRRFSHLKIHTLKHSNKKE